MKGLFRIAAAGLVAALALISVPAEAADTRSRIPFSFVVNGRTLPPGTYQFSIANNLLWVRDLTAAAVLTTSGATNDTDLKIVFHKYGDLYVLRQVWMDGSSVRNIPESRSERRLLDSKDTAVAMERVVVPAVPVV